MSTRLDSGHHNIAQWLTETLGIPFQLEVIHARPWSEVYLCKADGKNYWIKNYKKSFVEHKTLGLLKPYGKFPEVFQVNENLKTVIYQDLGELNPISNDDITEVIYEYLKLQAASQSMVKHLTDHPKWSFDKAALLADLENQSQEIVSTFKKAVMKLDESLHIQKFSQTLAHGDLHADNIFKDAQGSLVFLDWADSGAGYLGSSLESLTTDLDNLVILLDSFKEDFKNLIPDFEHEFSKSSLAIKFIIGNLWRIKDFLSYRNLNPDEQEFIREKVSYCCSEIRFLSSAL